MLDLLSSVMSGSWSSHFPRQETSIRTLELSSVEVLDFLVGYEKLRHVAWYTFEVLRERRHHKS
jgi:hypothetical protein